MIVTTAPQAITIHIPPNLQHLTVPLQTFLNEQPFVDCLAVGAFVFTQAVASPSAHVADAYRALYDFSATNDNEFTLEEGQLVEVIQKDDDGWSLVKAIDGRRQGWSPSEYLIQELSNLSETRLLLVQRSSQDSVPDLWEVPGGSSEYDDPTILHSVARELFEETGLHLTRFNRQIGSGVNFKTGHGPDKKRWLKLSFEVEALEIPRTSHDHVHGPHNIAGPGNNDQVSDQLLDSLPIKLDPREHQNFAWATEEDIWNSAPSRAVGDRGPFEIFNEEQRMMMLRAFELHRRGR